MGQSGFRLEDSDIFMDVKSSFQEYIQDGLPPRDATKAVSEEFEEALEDDDDALFVITALADAQMDVGKILLKTQKKCLDMIDYELSGKYDRGWTPTDKVDFEKNLRAFRSLVALGKRKPRPKTHPVKCTWKPGDVYAYPLTGKQAEQCGIAGRYLLIRMIEPFVMGRDVFPFVYFSVSAGTELPQTEQDVAAATYLQITYQRVYRIGIVSLSQEEFDATDFQYVGNFPYLWPPAEYVMPREDLGLYRATTLLSKLTEAACKKYSFFILGKPLE